MVLAKAENDPALYGLILLSATTGMRPSEYLALRWSDFDLETETICVQRSLSRKQRIGTTKAKTSNRTIKLSASVAAHFKTTRDTQFQTAQANGNQPPSADELVFPSSAGTAIDQANLRRRVKRLYAQAELPDATRVYDLRHTATTLLLSQGENIKVVSERLGHSSSAMTLDVYGHVLPHMQDEAAERMETMLFGRPPEPKASSPEPEAGGVNQPSCTEMPQLPSA